MSNREFDFIHSLVLLQVVDAKNFNYQLHEQKESGKISEAFLQIAYAVRKSL